MDFLYLQRKGKMDTKLFYGKGKRKAMIPIHPEESDVEDSEDDDVDVEDPDFVPDVDTESEDIQMLEQDRDSTSSHRKTGGKTRLIYVSDHNKDSVTSTSSSHKLWKKVDITQFSTPNTAAPEISELGSPFAYFSRLFTDEMVNYISEQTNLYSAQVKECPIQTNPKEIQDFLAILLYMGVYHFPSLDDYWDSQNRFDLIAEIMSRQRFMSLRSSIHFADSSNQGISQDRFYKVRPLFQMLRKQCLHLPASCKQSVHEVMVHYKGTRAGNLRQYISNKRDKWGFKLFCRASSTGIIHDFLLYQGKSTFFNIPQSEEDKAMLMGERVVTTLCKTVQCPESSVVFCDNYFTSAKLIQTLAETTKVRCLGTVRANRTGGAGDHLKTDKELCKEGRGAYDYRSSGGVIAVKWYDKKCVTLLSNACGVEPVGFVQRYSKEKGMKMNAVKCPAIIKAYNEHIGEIYLSDIFVHLYKSPTKSKRWYLPLFGYVLDLSVCNAWLLYKQDCSTLKEKPMPLKQFRTTVAHTLKGLHKMPARVGRPLCTSPPPAKLQRKRKRKQDTTPVADIRFDNTSHWPTCGPQRGRCRLCPKGVSRWRCGKCEVFLCLNTAQQCFVEYHMK